MQMQSTYWLVKVLKMISLYVSAFLCTLQHIVIYAMQLSGVNSENWLHGHSMSVALSWAGRKTCTRHGHRQLPEVVLTQFVSPDDGHDVLETCRELKIKINT